MVRRLRNSSFISLFHGFMAFYLLNICVDLPDALPSDVPEDLSYNDQESIIEIILEKVLGYEDAIPEHEDNDPDQKTTLKSKIAIDNFVLPFFKSKFNNQLNKGKKPNHSIYLSYIPSHYPEIPLPPPEA